MHIILLPAIIINILSIAVLIIGVFHQFEQPKNKAIFGYTINGCMLAYIITLFFAIIYGFLSKQYLYNIILLLCIASPFAIGKLAKYDTLKKYTVAQIICFIVSLSILLKM